jgi:hypothetical protein
MTGAAESEATGQTVIVAPYRGRDYKLPADAETWPLALIAASVGVNTKGQLVTDYPTTAHALTVLLDDQWPDFLRAFPQRRHLAPASTAFAAAAGFTAQPGDLAFGPLPRLLATLQLWPDAVEATLTAAGLDYLDRWRYTDDGRRRLTLRRIHVHLSCAPPDSALATAQNGNRPPFTATDLLLMDVFEAVARSVHPARPLTPDQRKQRMTAKDKADKAIEDYYKRHPNAAARKKTAIQTAQANAQPRKAPHAGNQTQAPDDDNPGI